MKLGHAVFLPGLVLVGLLGGCGSSDGVFVGDQCLSGNLANGQTYTKSKEADIELYPDTSGTEFTDDKKPASATDAGWFGYKHEAMKPLSVNIDVDLGAELRFNAVELTSGAKDARFVAAALNVWVSNDGTTWEPVGRFENSGNQFDLDASFKVLRARHIRFGIEARADCADCTQLFIGEGKVTCG